MCFTIRLCVLPGPVARESGNPLVGAAVGACGERSRAVMVHGVEPRFSAADRPMKDARMKPYVICHMNASVDGRILGSRWRPAENRMAGLFERLHERLGGGSLVLGRG